MERRQLMALMFYAALFSVVRWMLEFNRYSFNTPITGVCKYVPEMCLTSVIHCMFSYCVARGKQVSRVLCFGMSLCLFLFGGSLFISVYYSHCCVGISQAAKPLEMCRVLKEEGCSI